MNGKRLIYAFAILLAFVGIGSLAYFAWEAQKKAAQQRGFLAIYQEAEDKLNVGEAPTALQILNTRRPVSLPTDFPGDWDALTLSAALDAKQYPQVERLVSTQRRLLDANEDAALWWARTLMHRRESTMWMPILDAWKDKGKQTAQWLFLAADAAMVEGRLEQAREKLEEQRFTGSEEAQRRLRLAMVTSDPEAAWTEHSAAYTNAPNAPDTRLMAASFLESQGRTALARREYVAAAILEPQNPLYWDRLGAYYRRANALPQAIETWAEGLERTEDPRLWWRAWFWQRMTRDRGIELNPPTGDWWGGLPTELAAIPDRLFLGEAFNANHPSTPAILTEEEGFAWLQVLDALQNRDEAAALERLRFMPTDRAPYAPILRASLIRLLQWRVNGSWPSDPPVTPNPITHRFLRIFEDYTADGDPADPATLDTFSLFLTSDFAPSAFFLANGWIRAAHWLQPSLVPASFSSDGRLDWIPYAQVKSVAMLEGDEAALQAASIYPTDAATQVLAAELTLRTGALDQGLERLDAWLDHPSPAGFRAAYLRAMAALEREDFDRFEVIMNRREDLATRGIGKELRARAALAQNDRARASELYSELGESSTEALVFLYEEAKTARLWSEARAHVEALIRQAPNEPAFHRWARELDTLEQSQP